LRHLPDAPRFAGNGSIDISNLIGYLFLENDAQREKLLPKLAGQRKEVMKGILDRYKRTVKPRVMLRKSSKGVLTLEAIKD